jgi:hypothetical protein
LTPGRLCAALVLTLLAARVPSARADGTRPAPEAPPGAPPQPPPEEGTPRAEAARPEAPDEATSPEEAVRPMASVLQTYYPPPVDGPALRVPESPTRLYLDAAFAQSKDLSALPYIAGSANNLRFAAGGVLRWRSFSFEGELPFTQVTTIDVTAVPGGAPIAQDAHQTAVSLGDVRLGASWTLPLAGEALVAGFGLRGRLATHTTRFQFHIFDASGSYSLATYSFPYYFQVEPTLIVGGALGRFTFVINEGGLVFIGPNGYFDGMNVVVPTIDFWDSHVAVGYAPLDVLAASVELGSDIQVNHVSNAQFMINDVRSAWVAPAIQIHLGDYRVDLIARIGLTRGAEVFGVLDFIGTSSYTLRVGRAFN